MTTTYVLMQNLRRNPLRSALTAVAFALPMAVFVAAISLVVTLNRMAALNQKELRLGVHHKTTIVNMLPEGTRRKIEALDPERTRLTSVCGMRWFGGRVPNTQNTLVSMAADVDTFPTVYSEAGMDAADVGRWQRERRAAVIGTGLADQYKWKLGDRIVLQSTVPPYVELEFIVVKIMAAAERANFLFLRRDYLAEALKKEGGYGESMVNIFWVKCTSAAAMRSLQGEIDAMFANTPDETRSEDENAFSANMVQAAGNIPGLMQAMALVVVFIIALVAGNTMMMSFRERTRELAVFKAIGFNSRRVFLIVLSESVMLALIGALAGILPTATLLTIFPLKGLNMGPINSLEISPAAVIGSIVLAILVGLAAGLWPAYRAMRINTVDALRKVA